MRRFLALALVLMLVCPLLPVSGAGQETVPNYEYRELSPGNVKEFIALLQFERARWKETLEAKYRDKPKKIAENAELIAYDKVIADSTSLLGSLNSLSQEEAQRAFMKAQRVHYGIAAGTTSPEPEKRFWRRLKMGTNVVGGYLILNVPNVIDPTYRLGRKLAEKEAANLYRPGGKQPVTVDEMATMGAAEVSHLQPAPNHAALSGKAVGNNYQAFLDEQTALIRKMGGDLEKFDLDWARQVLTYDDLDADATSPKIAGKDRYGNKWKLKWGDEVHTDVAATRLYIDLGASYTDLKFYSGPGETILIMAPPSNTDPKAYKTFTELADALLASKFQFHAHRYLLDKPLLTDKRGNVLGHGQVDETMAEQLSLNPKFIGAYFVLFKECQLSLYNPAIKRLGGAALCNVGATEDRVARGSLVFNAWIKNKDMKDDNSRVGLLYNPETAAFDRIVEFQSDLGCTFGHLKPSGELNSFEEKMIMPMPQSINFVMRPLYVPDSWKSCTYADARWMALRICALSREDIERSVAESGWPWFAQKVAVEKLISRRNQLVENFKLHLDGVKELPCNTRLDLTAGKTSNDLVVKNGKINADSPTVQALEAAQHPEGLASIISRKND